MKLVLMRHCTTDWNLDRRIQGRIDTLLNHHGGVEAAKLGFQLMHLGITRIASSKQRRATKTSAIIAAILEIPWAVQDGLEECSFGTLEGAGYDDFDRACKEEQLTNPNEFLTYDFSRFGGETGVAVAKRYSDAIDALALAHPDDTVLVVSHEMGLRTFLASRKLEPMRLGNGQFVNLNL